MIANVPVNVCHRTRTAPPTLPVMYYPTKARRVTTTPANRQEAHVEMCGFANSTRKAQRQMRP
jgi:hypothetical protein